MLVACQTQSGKLQREALQNQAFLGDGHREACMGPQQLLERVGHTPLAHGNPGKNGQVL